MYKYIFKRIVALVPVLLLISFITFFILSMTPGDPGTMLLGPTAKQENIDKINEELGYNDPFLIRYGRFVWSAVQGDFGNSYRTKEPVFNEIIARFPYTITLDLLAIGVAILIGIPLGVLSAVKQYTVVDYTFTTIAMFLATIPGFWLGLMMILFFSIKLGWLPSSGVGSFAHYIMPALTLGIPTAASILRMTRTTMLETIRQDYIRTARSKGAPEKRVIWSHALRNALLPVITIIMTTFGTLLGGTVLIESVFALPGLGSLVVDAIRMKDIPQVMGATIFLATMFSLILLFLDLLYAVIDPRVKTRYKL